MEKHDVVVVGGGPAGLAAGVRCANEGVKTLLIERDPILTAKKSWILPVSNKRKRILESLDIDPSDFSDNYINSAKVSVIKNGENSISFDSLFPEWLKGYYVNHSKFTRYMLSKAKSLDVKEDRVIDAKRKDGWVDLILLNGEKLHARIVIDATGVGRSISTMLGREINWRAVWVNYGTTIKGVNPKDIGIGEHQFMFEFGFHEGDFYVFNPYPVNEDTVDFGMARYLYPADRRFDLTKDYCKAYLSSLYKKKLEKCGITKEETKEEREYYGFIGDGWETKPYDDNLLIVGDAAGHANEFENEGFLQSLVFGDIAGKVATDSIRTKNATAKFLKRYYPLLLKNDLYNRGLFGFATNLIPRDRELLILNLMCSVGNEFVKKYGVDMLLQWYVNELSFKDSLKLYWRVLPCALKCLKQVIK